MSDDTRTPVEIAVSEAYAALEKLSPDGDYGDTGGPTHIGQLTRYIPAVKFEDYSSYTEYITDIKLKRKSFGVVSKPVAPNPAQYKNQAEFDNDFRLFAREVNRYQKAKSRSRIGKFAMGVGLIAGGAFGPLIGAAVGGTAGGLAGAGGNRQDIFGGILAGASAGAAASSLLNMLMHGASFVIEQGHIVVEGPDGTFQLPIDKFLEEGDTPSDSLYRRRSNIIGTGLEGLTID